MLRAMCPLAALVLLVAMPLSARAETIVGLAENNNLVIFDSARPSAILSALPITNTGGDTLLGIDFRPATGQLYGLGHLGAPGVRLYTIDPVTGAATLVSALTADPADPTDPYTDVFGTDFGVNFNPVVDRIRVVTDTGQNLRVNPVTGGIITDTPLAFAAGDPNAGQIPKVVDAAYSNNVANATSTTLYGLEGIDPDLRCQKTQTDGTVVKALCLVRQGGADGAAPSPNSGQLFTLGPFGKEGIKAKGFDISPSATAFVAVQLKGDPLATFVLVTIDLTNGADSSRGPVSDGTVRLKDIAVAPSVQFSANLYAVRESAGTATITVTRNDDLRRTVTVNFATSDGTAKAGQDYGTTTGTLTFNPGEATQSFTIPIINDRRPERDQFLLVTLSNPSGGALLGAPGRCVFLSRPSPCVRGTAELRINVNDRVDRTGPILQRIGLTGPSRGITGAVLHFNEDLRPASAEKLRNYSLFAFAGRRRQRIALGSAVYDPVRMAVTLTVSEPFGQTQFTRLQIIVRGTRAGLTDLKRNLIDGEPDGKPGGDAVFRFRVFSGTAVTFRDLDGDLATLVLTGGGRLDGVVPIRARERRVISMVSNFPPRRQRTQFWIVNPIALKSTLSGTVTRTSGSNGIVVIAEIIGLDKKEFTPLITNPSFRVNTLTFSSNATGR